MKLKQQTTRADSEDKILPLINVIFLLLIFFMITGALTMSDPFEIEAPVSSSEADEPHDDFQVFISDDGDFALNEEVLAQEDVLRRLELALDNKTLGWVEIKADRRTEGNLVISFMNKLKELGVERVNLITEHAG